MKVAELIAKLQELPQDVEVEILHSDYVIGDPGWERQTFKPEPRLIDDRVVVL